jgi:hypothetical protein
MTDPLAERLMDAVDGFGHADDDDQEAWGVFWDTLARAAREHIAAEIEADAAHLLPGMTHRDEMEDAARIARGRP